MKKFSLILFFILFLMNSSQGAITGKINHDDVNFQNKIIDTKTKKPIGSAKITIPELHYTTYSDTDGTFKLNADVSESTVMFVEKEGYKVFSLTVDNSVIKNPLKLGIEQNSPFDLQISTDIIHLGDDMFSQNSANSTQFKMSAKGPSYIKAFDRPKAPNNADVILRIGTIIGLDTKKAKENGQNRIVKVYSSPAEVYVNGVKISKLELNGDNIEIVIPKNVLKDKNELLIQTGRNLFQYDYVDYDDIEIANLRIEIKEKSRFARF